MQKDTILISKSLSYKAGDSYLAHACGKSNQPLYSLIARGGVMHSIRFHCLPLAPKANHLQVNSILPTGATIKYVVMASEQQELLMASDAGYGFICKFEDLIARNKAGKPLISLPENAKVLKPKTLINSTALVVAITSAGRMLIFPAQDLPVLSKVKAINNHYSRKRMQRS